MRIDPDTCHNSILLAAEVRRLNAVIAASQNERLSQNSDCPAPENAANSDKVFPQQTLTIHGAAPAATAQLDTAERDSDHVAGTGDTLTDADREPSLASAGSHDTHMATARLSAANTWLQEEIKRLRLTDAEREAIAWCVGMAETTATECDEELAALRGLLERTK
jgi:hypothetical protein